MFLFSPTLAFLQCFFRLKVALMVPLGGGRDVEGEREVMYERSCGKGLLEVGQS